MTNYQRGRKSPLKLLKPKPTRVTSAMLLEPPEGLAPAELAVWHEIVDAMPLGYFGPGAEPLLRCLVSFIVTADTVAEKIANTRVKEDLELLDKLTAIHARASLSVANLSARLKLTPQSKMSVERAENLQKLNSTVRPWRQ